MTGANLPATLLDQVPAAARADEAEATLLGCILNWPTPCLAQAEKVVRPDDFFDPARQRLFAFLLGLGEDTRDGFDLASLERTLKQEGVLEAVGGRDALIDLIEQAATAAAAPMHAEAIRQAATTRRIRDFACTLLRKTGRADFRPADLLGTIEQRVARLAQGNGHAADALAVRTAAEIKPERVSWVWPGRIPAGKLTILLGNPGQGKSLASLAVAAAVTRGCGWPDDPAFRARPATVLLASAEDEAADTLVPRAQAADVDLARLQVIDGIGDEKPLQPLDLGRHLDALRAHLATTTDARLLILDPLAAFMLGPDTWKSHEVRAALTPLSALAQETGVGILAIRHMRKSPAKALHRGLGSVAFAAAARSVIGIGPDPANPNGPRRLLVPVKQNLTAPPPALAFSIEVNGDGVPTVQWEAAPVQGVDADAVLSGFNDGAPGPDADARNEAEAWLREALAGGPVPTKDLQRMAKDAGHAWATVKRAKKALDVQARKDGFGSHATWHWTLPEQRRSSDREGAQPQEENRPF